LILLDNLHQRHLSSSRCHSFLLHLKNRDYIQRLVEHLPILAARKMRKIQFSLGSYNSDDPPYFDGYVTENLMACRDALGLSMEEIVHLVRNGLEAAFVTKEERQILLRQLDTYLARHAAASTPQKS
jgi:Adenosine deaminase